LERTRLPSPCPGPRPTSTSTFDVQDYGLSPATFCLDHHRPHAKTGPKCPNTRARLKWVIYGRILTPIFPVLVAIADWIQFHPQNLHFVAGYNPDFPPRSGVPPAKRDAAAACQAQSKFTCPVKPHPRPPRSLRSASLRSLRFAQLLIQYRPGEAIRGRVPLASMQACAQGVTCPWLRSVTRIPTNEIGIVPLSVYWGAYPPNPHAASVPRPRGRDLSASLRGTLRHPCRPRGVNAAASVPRPRRIFGPATATAPLKHLVPTQRCGILTDLPRLLPRA